MKKVLSLFLVVSMMLSLSLVSFSATAETDLEREVFVDVSAVITGDENFWAWIWDDNAEGHWVPMHTTETSYGYFVVTMNVGQNVVFTRIRSGEQPDWTLVWNQTEDLKYTGEYNCAVLSYSDTIGGKMPVKWKNIDAIDKSALVKAIREAEKYIYEEADKYTSTSIANLQNAYFAAQSCYEFETIQINIDNATKNLNDAISNLVLKDEPVITPDPIDFELGAVLVSLEFNAPSVESLLPDFDIEEARLITPGSSTQNVYHVKFTEKSEDIVWRAIEVLNASPYVKVAEPNYYMQPDDTVCEHTYIDGVCSSCGEVCEHTFVDDVCSTCGKKEDTDSKDEPVITPDPIDFELGAVLVSLEFNAPSVESLLPDFDIEETRLITPGSSTQNVYHVKFTEKSEDIVWRAIEVLNASPYVKVAEPNYYMQPDDTVCEHTYIDGVCSSCGEVCEHTFVDDVCSTCGKAEDIAAKLEGYSIELGGNIAVNFHMTLSDDITSDEDAKVVFTLPNNKKQTVYIKDATVTDSGYYVFTCEVNALQMSESIKAQVVATEYESDIYSYSVVEYAEKLLKEAEGGNTEYTDAVPLVKSMLNYGANAQTYFGYRTDDLANKNLSEADKVLEDVKLLSYMPKITGKESGIRNHGVSLTLNSETELNIYFAIEDEDNIPDFCVNGASVTPVKAGDYYKIKIANISAQNLDEEYVVTVGGLTAKYSAMSYGYMAMYTQNNAIKNVIRALYAYNQAANAYIEG